MAMGNEEEILPGEIHALLDDSFEKNLKTVFIILGLFTATTIGVFIFMALQ